MGKINESGANQKDQVVFLGIDLSKKGKLGAGLSS